jgi:GNAT superfamily N-acetyltransferase
LSPIEVIQAPDLAEPLSLLEESLRDGEPVPKAFAERLRKSVEAGDIEVLASRTEDRTIGVAIIALRLNISAGDLFASIEDLYVHPNARRQGVGRALLTAADERCASHGISYVEVQVEGKSAEAFYRTVGYDFETGTKVFSRSLALPET